VCRLTGSRRAAATSTRTTAASTPSSPTWPGWRAPPSAACAAPSCAGQTPTRPTCSRTSSAIISSPAHGPPEGPMDTSPIPLDEPPLPKGDRNENPPGIGFFALLREDLRTHDGALFEQGFWAVAVHRFGNRRMGFRWKIFRAPLTLLYRMLFKWVEWTCG